MRGTSNIADEMIPSTRLLTDRTETTILKQYLRRENHHSTSDSSRELMCPAMATVGPYYKQIQWYQEHQAEAAPPFLSFRCFHCTDYVDFGLICSYLEPYQKQYR